MGRSTAHPALLPSLRPVLLRGPTRGAHPRRPPRPAVGNSRFRGATRRRRGFAWRRHCSDAVTNRDRIYEAEVGAMAGARPDGGCATSPLARYGLGAASSRDYAWSPIRKHSPTTSGSQRQQSEIHPRNAHLAGSGAREAACRCSALPAQRICPPSGAETLRLGRPPRGTPSFTG